MSPCVTRIDPGLPGYPIGGQRAATPLWAARREASVVLPRLFLACFGISLDLPRTSYIMMKVLKGCDVSDVQVV